MDIKHFPENQQTEEKFKKIKKFEIKEETQNKNLQDSTKVVLKVKLIAINP